MGAVHAVPGRAAACPWARVCTHTQLCAGRRTTAAPWPINTYVREQCRGPVLVFWAHISPWFVWERCGSELGSIRRSCAAFRVGLLLDGVGLRVLFSAPVPTGEPEVAVGRERAVFLVCSWPWGRERLASALFLLLGKSVLFRPERGVGSGLVPALQHLRPSLLRATGCLPGSCVSICDHPLLLILILPPGQYSAALSGIAALPCGVFPHVEQKAPCCEQSWRGSLRHPCTLLEHSPIPSPWGHHCCGDTPCPLPASPRTPSSLPSEGGEEKEEQPYEKNVNLLITEYTAVHLKCCCYANTLGVYFLNPGVKRLVPRSPAELFEYVAAAAVSV